MTVFASKTPRDLNRDPHPNVWDGHSQHDQMRDDTDMFRKGAPYNYKRYTHRPRPEFDHVQHNEPNPVLTWAREVGTSTALDEATFSSGSYMVGAWVGDQQVTSDHVVHARRVLTRLVRMADQ